MVKMIVLAQCPNCKNKMKAMPKAERLSDIGSKRKRCVFCGKSFLLKKAIVKKL